MTEIFGRKSKRSDILQLKSSSVTRIIYPKFKFDTAFKDGHTTTGVVLRNADGCLLGAQVSQCMSDNAYCAELEAALQAFHIATRLKIDQDHLKGMQPMLFFSTRAIKI